MMQRTMTMTLMWYTLIRHALHSCLWLGTQAGFVNKQDMQVDVGILARYEFECMKIIVVVEYNRHGHRMYVHLADGTSVGALFILYAAACEET